MRLQFNSHGNEKQKVVYRYWNDSTVSDIVYGGSKGSGKSFLGCSLIFGDALMYDGTHYFIARKKLNDLRKFTIPSIYEVFTLWDITEKYYTYNGQDNYFQLFNGSRVYLIEAAFQPGDPLYQRFGSMQMTRGWIEEAGEFEEAAKNNLMASIGRWKNDVYNLAPKLLQTCNPAKNYLYREYYRKFKDGVLEFWKRFVQALPQDNKKLPASYLENLERTLSETEKRRLIRGDWEYDSDPATLIDYDRIIDIFSNIDVPIGKKCITSDAARLGGDRIVKIEWIGFRGKVEAWSKKELDVTGKRLQDARIRMGIAKSDVLVDEDGVGGGIVDYEKFKGFRNKSSPVPNPKSNERDKNFKKIPENFDMLKSQCGFHMAKRINEKGIYLQCSSEHRDLIIEELEQVKQKNLDSDLKKGLVPKDKVKELIGRSPDFWDTILMREWFALMPKTEIIIGSVQRTNNDDDNDDYFFSPSIENNPLDWV